ncbi:hypothetical protein IWX49DRAFT_390657 [Phyllosticta citricarpa]|uniref:Secreted peptide n=1 Tax=Phyllosticta citricarpa TaxID=55181 RepID=A0ABR1MCV1_9PEZI
MRGWVWASALHRVSLWRMMRLAIVSILLYRDDDVLLLVIVVVVVDVVVVGMAVRIQSSMRETATDRQTNRKDRLKRVPLVSGLGSAVPCSAVSGSDP